MFHRYIYIFVVLKELWKYLEDSLLPTRNQVALDQILSRRFCWKKLHLKTACLIDLPCSVKPMHYNRGSKYSSAEKLPAVQLELHLPSIAVAGTRGLCKALVCSATSRHIGHLAKDRQLDALFCSPYEPFCCIVQESATYLYCQMSCVSLSCQWDLSLFAKL